MNKKNIIYIFWTNLFAVEYEKLWLQKLFKQKYGNESIEICSLENREKYRLYRDTISTPSLLWEKRMFIFSWGETKKKWENIWFELYIEEIANTLTDNDFLIFYNISPSEKKLISWLKKHASLRERNISWKYIDWQKYTSTSPATIQKILKIYEQWEKMREYGETNPFIGKYIFMSLEQASILEEAQIAITDDVLETITHPFDGAKIFDFTDAIMQKNITAAIEIFDTIKKSLESTTIDIFIASCIGIIRKNAYIVKLRDTWLSQQEIGYILPKIHSYMLAKVYNSPISSELLSQIFQKLISINMAYKSGKWMKKNVLWRIFEIDTVLFWLKN